jgi:UDP-N-acetyl-D-glucosamine dehydrogenase
VGLPLGVAFAEAGFKVLGFDILKKRVDLVNHGKSFISDVTDDRIKKVISSKNFQATTVKSRIRELDCIFICVPTPLTRTKEPDLSYVIKESREIARFLTDDILIVLESTTYPGTTREVVCPILESSKLKCGINFHVAFSPERVDPGNTKYNLKNTPKIVGGIDEESTELAYSLYTQVAEKVMKVSCPEVAEMTKVFENVFRSVNIALVNELAQLCHRMGISVWEVINAASTKPFGYMPFYPGPGVGGHCIPLDPYYLASKAREYDFHTRFIELAAEVNEHMPYYVAFRIMEKLNDIGVMLNGADILVLGITYKKDSKDLRESPILKIIKVLIDKGACVSYSDPYVPSLNYDGIELKSVPLNNKNISAADCILITTDHSSFDYKNIISRAKLVYDTRGVTRGTHSKNIIRLGE